MKRCYNIRKSFLFIIGLLITWIFTCEAQSQSAFPSQLFFKRISTEQGLPQPTVNAILRDSRGFIWFATEDGLSRFDGNEFKIFRHDPSDSTSLSHNVIHFIQEEKATGNLWIGTVSGISYFNRLSERFTVYHGSSRPGTIYVNGAIDQKRNRLWLASSVGGLCYIDLSLQKIVEVEAHNLHQALVWTVNISGDSLIIGTLQKGLKVLDLRSNHLTTIDSTSNIRALLTDQHNIWFGTESSGLGRFNRATKKVTYFTQENGNLNNNSIWSLAKDAHKNLWIGTDGGGLNILMPFENKARAYRHSEFDERSISANTIRSIFIEPDGHAWLGTHNGGVNYHANTPIQFLWYKKEVGNENSLSNNVVTSFTEANDGTIWIGTDGGGLHYLKDGTIYRQKLPGSLSHIKVITSLLSDDTGLWLGTFQDGLLHLNSQGGCKQYLHDPRNKTTIANNIVWSIQKDSLGYLWLGTDRGANRFDPKTEVFQSLNNPIAGNINQLFRNIQAQTILISNDNTLWVGSYGLLTAYIPASDSVVEIVGTDVQGYRKIPNLRVKALLEDNRKIWIGTYGNGLCQYDPATHSLSILDERDGLPNNIVLSIEKGQPGSLWLSTNKGLVHFNIADTLFTTLDANYDVQGTIFNRDAALRTSDGRLLFGGRNGFNIFKPEKFVHDLNSLAIVFTDFLIFNESVKPVSNLLRQSITETSTLNLPHADSRLITLKFSALNFSSPARVIYVYKLKGFNNEWQPVGKDHSVTFTNLDPGGYTLYVKASFNGRSWGPQKTLSITIQTPWWMTHIFRWGSFVLFCIIGYSLYMHRTYQLRKRKKELEHLVDIQSHEIKRQNEDLAAQNEELLQQNEAVNTQKETISVQNEMLQEAKEKLQKINESLEQAVHQRTEKLNETIVQLNKTIKELDAFVYSASHDLVAPLKSVLGLVELARRESPEGEIHSYLNHIELSIKKLEDVIKNMIHYSRNARLDVILEPVDLQALIDECFSDVKFMAGAEAVNFEVHLEGDVVILSDRQRLKIVLSNLINNAVKYRDVRKERSNIVVSFKKGKASSQLEVFDNGIGIDKQYLSRVFEMFYRATDRAQGSGLGLYIVKETVERLYGEIHVDSEKGQWTKFVLTLPHERSYFKQK